MLGGRGGVKMFESIWLPLLVIFLYGLDIGWELRTYALFQGCGYKTLKAEKLKILLKNIFVDICILIIMYFAGVFNALQH